MAGNTLTYVPSDVKIIISGWHLTGVVSVSLKFDSKPFTVHKGIKGEHTRVFNSDLYSILTIEVLQTSATNDVLSQILEQDRRVGSARLVLTVQDTSGTSLLQSSNCFLSRFPDNGFDNGFQTRKWDIEILSFVNGRVGGNANQGFDLFDSFQGAVNRLTNLIN